MSIKNIFILLLCVMLAVSSPLTVHVYAKDQDTENQNEMVAEAILGQELVQSGFSLVEPGTNKEPYVVTRGGEYCWLMDKLQGTQKAYINFILSRDFLGSTADGSEYVVEFDYYDSGSGYCRLFYDANDLSMKEAGTVYLNNERIWKTASFVLQDAAVSKRLDNKYDFQLSIRAMSNRSSISGSSIAIKRFKVTRRVARNPIYLVSWNDEVGNAYKWFEKDKIIHNKFTNLTDRNINATVTHRFISEDYMVPFEKTEELTFAPHETKEVDLNFGELERCDVYRYEVEIISKDNTVHSKFQPYEIAVLKTDPDGILNRDVFFAAHLERYSIDRIKEAVKVLKMSNIGGIRGDFSWSKLEPVKGQYNWEGHPMKPVLDELAANGLLYLPIMDVSSLHYCKAWNELPHTPEQLEGWRNYIRAAAGILNSYGIERYEIWNEPNITAFNVDNAGGDVYAQMVKVAYEEIKKVNPSAKLGGPCVTGLKAGTGKEYFMQAMNAGMWRYAEAITLHPYTSMSPEEAEMDKVIQWFKDEYAKVGVEDPEIWNTEVGYTTADKGVATERRKGAWNSQSAIFYKSKDVSDITVFYNFEKKGTVATEREDQFGHVSGAYDECIKYGKYFVPTISYVMVTGLNYIMADSTAVGRYDSEDNNIRIAKFRSNKFNADIVTLYALHGRHLVTLNLGADKITYYDSMGNGTEIYGHNGVFTFVADEEPAYIVGHIKNVELVDNNPFISYDQTDYSVAENDTAKINIRNYTGEPYKIEVKTPLYVKVVQIDQFDGDTGVGCVYIKNNMPVGEECHVDIHIVTPDGKIVQNSSIKLVSTNALITSLKIEPLTGANINRWVALMNISNMSSQQAIKGYVEFKSPQFMVDCGKVDIGIIPKRTTGEVNFNIPELARKGQYTVEYDIVLDGGKRFEFTDTVDATVATYAYNKPKIDGVIESGEWNRNTTMYADNIQQVKQIDDWQGVNDLSGQSAVMWDEENFYMFVEVTDDVFCQPEPGPTNWKGDSVQFGIFYGTEDFIAIGQGAMNFHEIGLSLSPEGPTAYRFKAQDESHPIGYCEGAEVAVVRNRNKTIYEFKIPWVQLLREGDKPKENDKLGFSFLINDNDGNGRRGWIEYASGIGETKNVNLFTYLTLIK